MDKRSEEHPDLSDAKEPKEESEDVEILSDQDSSDNMQTVSYRSSTNQRRESYGTAYPCQYCSNSYRYYGTFYAHMRKAHPTAEGDNKFPCDFPGCGRVLSSVAGRKMHAAVHTKKIIKVEVKQEVGIGSKRGISPSPFPPSTSFHRATRVPLKRYSKDQLENSAVPKKFVIVKREPHVIKPFKNHCMECKRFFYDEHYLNLHKMEFHTEKKETSCGKCGQEYGANENVHRCKEPEKVNSSHSDHVIPLVDTKMVLHPQLGSSTPLTSAVVSQNEQANPTSFTENIVDPVTHRDSPMASILNLPSERKDTSLLNSFHIIPGVFINDAATSVWGSKKGEKSLLPLSSAVIEHAKQNPAEMMVIWSNALEDDLLTAVTLSKKNYRHTRTFRSV